MPYTDQFTVGLRAAARAGLLGQRRLRPRVQSRDLLMSRELNPTLRNSTTVARSTLTHGRAARLLTADDCRAAGDLPGLRAVHDGRDHSGQRRREPTTTRCCCQLEKRFSNNYSARVSYTYSHSRGNTSGDGVPASGFQVLDDLQPGPERRADQLRHAAQLRRQRHGARAANRRADRQLGRARPERHAVQPRRTAHRSGSQRHASASRLPAGTYSGTGADAYTVDDYRASATAPAAGLLQARHAARLHAAARRHAGLELFGEIFNLTNRANFANPSGNQAADELPGADRVCRRAPPRARLQFGARFVF